MPPKLERPVRRDRHGQWQLADCLVRSNAAPHSWRPEPERWHIVYRSSPRRALEEPSQSILLGAKPDAVGPEVDVELFNRLADQWETETAFESVVTRKALHPAYQRIIGLGKPAVPLILERLAKEPAQWFWALTSITGEDPARGETALDGAAGAWIAWGRARRLVDR